MSTRFYISSCCESGGVYLCELTDTGELTIIEKTALPSPMYTVIHEERLYIILRAPFEGSDTSGILSAKIEADGRLTDLTECTPTDGIVACHLCVNENGVYTANYVSGSIKKLGGNLIVRHGSGPNKVRQDKAHMHYVTAMPDGNILTCDLGCDAVAVYDKDFTSLISEARVPEGHGARHLAVAGDNETVWCINELASTITRLKYDGKLTSESTFELYPGRDITGTTAAAIRLSADGKTLYASNRGFDLITAVDISGDTPKVLESVSTCGGSPRDFDISPDGRFMVVTNEKDGVSVFKMRGNVPEYVSGADIEATLCVTFLN